jgi:signal transduction histidine kinase
VDLGTVVVAVLLAACVAVGWARARRQARPARLTQLGWNAGLLVLAVALMQTSPFAAIYPGKLAIPLGAAAVAAVAPRAASRLVPPLLILLGMTAFAVARDYNYTHYYTGRFAGLAVGDFLGPTIMVLPLAYLLLAAGGWLAWRADRTSPAMRLVWGRLAEPERRGQLWAFLLLPVTFAAGALISPQGWFGGGLAGGFWTIAVLAAAWLTVTRWPDRAAALATGGLIAVGIVMTVAAASPASVPHLQYGYVLDGLLAFSSSDPGLGPVALAQGLAVAAFGVLLAPATVPWAARLVGRTGEGELTQRVQRLTESRAVAVDTAAADLRRLERDLHDGAQARLVALGMNLRAAEKLFPVSPDAALALVAEARQASARALTELRELVRGVHPPVLADRGLGDALRALALDTPMKITMDIDLPGRLPAPIETACYFAVAEVLTNAVKHSGARAGQVCATHADGMLKITVTDFGVGGADPARGTGLAGVERRLAAFDGVVAVSSPVGGPTMVIMEVPCASSRPGTGRAEP